MKTTTTMVVATALALSLTVGTSAMADLSAATPKPHAAAAPSHHAHPVAARPVRPMREHPMPGHPMPAHPVVEHPARPMHPVATRRAAIRPNTAHSKVVVRRTTVTRTVTRTVTTWRDVSQPITTFQGRTRVVARAVAISNAHVIVRMPNDTLRTFVAFREANGDHDRIVVRERGETRTLRVMEVSRPVAHRIVVFTNEEVRERQPELTVLQAFAPTEDEVMVVQPNSVLEPFAVTAVQPLPFGQVATFGDNVIGPTFAPADVTFVGQVINVAGDLVTFMLPDGTTRTLVDMGPLPSIGTQLVVTENGQQVVGLSSANTNFTGQVIGDESPFVTFVLPNGTVRTLTMAQPLPAPGTRLVVFENGDRVERITTL